MKLKIKKYIRILIVIVNQYQSYNMRKNNYIAWSALFDSLLSKNFFVSTMKRTHSSALSNYRYQPIRFGNCVIDIIIIVAIIVKIKPIWGVTEIEKRVTNCIYEMQSLSVGTKKRFYIIIFLKPIT